MHLNKSPDSLAVLSVGQDLYQKSQSLHFPDYDGNHSVAFSAILCPVRVRYENKDIARPNSISSWRTSPRTGVQSRPILFDSRS